MTQKAKTNDGTKVTLDMAQVKSVLMAQPDFLQPVVQEAVQAILEVEMEECLQAGKHERSEGRLGYRSGYYRRRLITRVGTMVLRVPQDRAGHFSTQVFEQYQRSEKALVAALAQMYVQGVSTRKVAAITEELCGHEFSASSISTITARLDGQLEEFSRRPLDEAFPYVVVDARYERVREGGVIVSRAILIALGIDWEGRRQVLAVEYANRESQSSWREFLLQLQGRGADDVFARIGDDCPVRGLWAERGQASRHGGPRGGEFHPQGAEHGRRLMAIQSRGSRRHLRGRLAIDGPEERSHGRPERGRVGFLRHQQVAGFRGRARRHGI